MDDMNEFVKYPSGIYAHREIVEMEVVEELSWAISTPRFTYLKDAENGERAIKRSIERKILDEFRKFVERQASSEQEGYALGLVTYTYRSRPYPYEDTQITGYAKVYRAISSI